jgi:hypothetical protein
MNRVEKLKMGRAALILAAGVLLMAACQPQDAPAKAIERYLGAVVDKDADKAVTASCASWEDSARQEVDSFKAVTVSLKDLSCASTGDDGDAKLVACSGSIAVSYNAENREVSLQGKVYRATQEGGDWRMCGYK